MKTFFVKKGKGAKPVVGASIVEKKPTVGEYINFNVPTNIKYALTAQGGLVIGKGGAKMNTLVNADNIILTIDTNFDGSLGGTNLTFSTAIAPLNADNTIGALLNALNTRLGGMGHVVLEDGIFYLTKLGLAGGEITNGVIDAINWC